VRRKVHILRRTIPLWLIAFLFIASGIGAAVGTIIAGQVTGDIPVQVGQSLLVGEPMFPDSLPEGVDIQTIRIEPRPIVQSIGIVGDDWTSFQAAAEANTGDVFLIQLPLKNASNQGISVELTLDIPNCIEVDVFGADDETASAVDHVFNVTQLCINKWVFCLSDMAERYIADWRDSIGIVVGIDDDCMPGCYNIGVNLVQIAGGCENRPLLDITKTAPSTADINEQLTYSIEVTNESEGLYATDVVVTDVLPAGMTYVSSSPTANITGSTLVWDVGGLAAGDSSVMQITVETAQSGRWTNRATAVCAEGIVVEAEAITEVGLATVDITKYGPSQLSQGATGSYTITAINNGSSTLTGVTVTDQIPSGMSYVSSSPIGSVVGKTVTWSVGSLVASQQRQMTLVLRADSAGTWTNTATVSTYEGLTATDSATTTIGGTTGVLNLTKNGPATLNQGTNGSYTITATNTGGSILTGVSVTDQIPTGMSYVSSSPIATVVGKTVTWSLGYLGISQQRQMTLVLKGDSAGTWTNTAAVTSNQGLTDTDSATTVISAAAGGMTMYTYDTEDPIKVGEFTTYVITTRNQGTTTLHNMVIENIIPSQMSFISASGPTGYTVTGQTVTFNPVAVIAPNETKTFYVTVKAESIGAALNISTMIYDEFPLTVTEQEGTGIYAGP
jgi:uncharacterized repeat protein (TIGR01451 family)